MKKIPKQLTALLLATVMFITVLPVSVFAESTSDPESSAALNSALTDITKLEALTDAFINSETIEKAAGQILHQISTAIRVDASSTNFKDGCFNPDKVKSIATAGDSTVFGFGLEPFSEDHPEYFSGENFFAQGSYSGYLKKRFVTADDHFYQLAIAGSRAQDMRYLLEDRFYYKDKLDGFPITTIFELVDLDAVRSDYQTKIQNADLITVGIGSNDLFTTALARLLEIINRTEDEPPFELKWEQFPGLNRPLVNRAIDAMINLISYCMPQLGLTLQNIKDLSETLVYGLVSFYYNVPKVIDDVHRMNPQAKIVIVGLFNPIRIVKIPDEYKPNPAINIDEFVSALLSVINSHLRNYALNHNAYCCYVNAPNIRLFGDDEPLDLIKVLGLNIATANKNDPVLQSLLKTVHSDPRGHHEVYTEILKALRMDHHAHCLKYIEEVPATCVSEGTKAHYECVGGCTYENCEEYAKGCGKYFADAAGRIEVFAQDLVIPSDPNAHQFKINSGNCALCGKSNYSFGPATDTGIDQTPYAVIVVICGLLTGAVLLSIILIRRRRNKKQ